MKYFFHLSLLVCALMVLLVSNSIAGNTVAQVAMALAVAALLGVSWLTGRGMRGSERASSTNTGFYLYLLLGFLVLIFEYYGKGVEPPSSLHALILVPLVATAFVSLLRRFGPVSTVQWMCYLVGGCWLGFALVSHGLSLAGLIESAPFLLMLAPAFIVKRWPRVTGGLLTLLGAAALVMFGGAWLRTSVWQLLLLGALMPFPLLALGLMLLLGHRRRA